MKLSQSIAKSTEDIELVSTNLGELKQEEMDDIQSAIGVGLAKIAKATRNLTSMTREIPLHYKQNQAED